MSIKITYTSWSKEDNFMIQTGKYQTLPQFIDQLKNQQILVNQKITSILQKRGDLKPLGNNGKTKVNINQQQNVEKQIKENKNNQQ